jgi:hypothetical protein
MELTTLSLYQQVGMVPEEVSAGKGSYSHHAGESRCGEGARCSASGMFVTVSVGMAAFVNPIKVPYFIHL